MYLESHMEFATASTCWKSADEIFRSSALRFLDVERTNGRQVDVYVARRLFSAAHRCSKYTAGLSKKAVQLSDH